VELIQEIGSYAGFAAVVGLGILSALYFSQARDVRRLRDWAGRAPERAMEAEITASRTPSPAVRQVAPVAAREAAVAAGAGATAAAATGDDAEESEGEREEAEDGEREEVAAVAEAKPAAGNPAAATAAGASSAPAPARAGAGPAPATAAAGARPATASAGTAVADGEKAGAAVAEGRPGGASTAVAEGGDGAAGGGPPGERETGTGVKVLPSARPTLPPRPRPTIPRPSGDTAILTQPPGSRPPGRRGGGWPAPRYVALIVAGVVILGLGGTVGVVQLTKDEEEKPANPRPPAEIAGADQGDEASEAGRRQAPAVDPSTVTVAVLNATNVGGLAARIGSRLEAGGFVLGNVTNAADRQRPESVALFKPGANAKARAVARKLGITQIEPIDAQSETLAGAASVVVVVGADKSGQ
jgi:hypothetical protein